MPISAEDAANLQEPLIPGLGSHDEHHKAFTAHLPPREVQEQRLRDAQKAREQKEGSAGHLSIHLPPRDGIRNADILSSPSSTIDAQSAATPAMHDASTDTSPENDNSRYDVEGTEGKENDIPTPPELRHTPEEIAEKARHDRLLEAQIKASRDAILRSSPTAAENQLLEEQAAIDEVDDSRTQDGTNEQQSDHDPLTRKASEVVEDDVEDTNVPNDEQLMSEPRATGTSEKGILGKPMEIADSEAEETPPVDVMDVDTTTVKDSFESAPTLDEPVISGAPETAEPVAQPAPDQPGSSATPAESTPQRTPSSTVAAPTFERMTTRVASGAMRHKSLSEILGEAPKQSSSSASIRGDSDSPRNSNSPSRSTTPQSPGTRVRSLIEKAKEKERSKLSTVIFPGRPSKPSVPDPAQTSNGVPPPTDDYFLPLFVATTATEKRGGPSLENLLATAHKTITTSNAYVPLHENQTVKVLKRIYNLQCSNKWSLRQQKRSPEVVRPTTHWDVLLQEVKWMRTDFREERKWKMTVARNLAYACAEYQEASDEDRKLLKVNAWIPPKPDDPNAPRPSDPSNDTEMGEASSQAGAHPTPDLVASGGSDSPADDLDEEPRFSLTDTVSPTAIFGLHDDDVVFGLRKSPTTDRLLNELPMYGAPLMVPQSDLPTSEIDPDRFWKRPALPLSKYVEGRMELKVEPPPRKRSRFEYEEEDDDDDHVVFGEAKAKRPILPPENSDVALFDPAHKATRERIHNSHQFRPPSEFMMPAQSFYENRHSSQWTWDEDNQLKGLVREFNYNWGLISNFLTSKSLFSSGAERRTPWECFERWVQQEGMPADMGRTHYFRMYTNRIDTANRNVLAQAPPQQPNANGQVQPAPRRRTTSSVRVERRRNQKHLTLVDAMRKLAKKRETNAQKQQHAAGMAAMRKANENPVPVNRHLAATTPQDFSRLKAEREEQMRERIQQMQQRQDQQRRVILRI
jgi:chromatin modification-related protein VID21